MDFNALKFFKYPYNNMFLPKRERGADVGRDIEVKGWRDTFGHLV